MALETQLLVIFIALLVNDSWQVLGEQRVSNVWDHHRAASKVLYVSRWLAPRPASHAPRSVVPAMTSAEDGINLPANSPQKGVAVLIQQSTCTCPVL